MKKMFIYCLLLCNLLENSSIAATIRYYGKSDNSLANNSSYEQNYDEYTQDLGLVEKYLFGKIYVTDSSVNRISRIERRLFGRVYPAVSVSKRMNNILANYELNAPYNSYYNARDNYFGNMSLKDRVINSLIGQPTGYTPQIYPSPYLNDRIAPSYMQGYYGNNSLKYHNIIRPVSTGAGVHILQ